MNCEPHPSSGFFIKVGMGREKRVRFRGRRIGKAVDIMVAVALGMRHPDKGPERGILLHAPARLAGQIFAGNKEFCVPPHPVQRTRQR